MATDPDLIERLERGERSLIATYGIEAYAGIRSLLSEAAAALREAQADVERGCPACRGLLPDAAQARREGKL